MPLFVVEHMDFIIFGIDGRSFLLLTLPHIWRLEADHQMWGRKCGTRSLHTQMKTFSLHYPPHSELAKYDHVVNDSKILRGISDCGKIPSK